MDPTLDIRKYNMDLATRQTRMNQYAYQNKMDTLFFFQILLISLLILGIFAYGVRVGFFSNALLIYVALLLLVINVILFLSRYAYTHNLRDTETWNRRRFTYEAPVAPVDNPLTSLDFERVDFSGKFGLPANVSGIDIQGLCTAYNKPK